MDSIGYFAGMRAVETAWIVRHGMAAVACGVMLSGTPTVSAQLTNPGFETATDWPSAPGMWHLLPGWNNALSGLATPDFFHLEGTLGGDLPETPVALINPAEGRGVAGLAVIKRNGAGQPLSREYLVQELSEPLVQGQRYTLSFRMANGWRIATSNSGLAVNGVGIAMSVGQPAQFGEGRIDLPTVFHIPYARYHEAWEQVTFSFEALAPHRFMTIGVFLEDGALEAEVKAGTNPALAYYFFDDFSLQIAEEQGGIQEEIEGVKGPDAPLAGGEAGYGMFIPNAFSPNGDGVNDFFVPEVGDVLPASFSIYSRWGERIATLDPGMPRWDGRNAKGQMLEPGVYIWMLEWPRSVPRQVRNQQGAVMLLH